MNFSLNSQDLRLFEPEEIALEAEDFDRAVQVSQSVVSEARQWQVYLNILGILALDRWVGDRAKISLNLEKASVFEAAYAQTLDAVCNCELNGFKICAIVAESYLDETVKIPKIAVDIAEFSAHFYVAIEVLEESEIAIVRGILRGDRLLKYRESQGLQSQSDWTYHLPLSCFEVNPDRLLFYTRFLSPEAIAVPAIEIGAIAPFAETELQPLLANPDRPLWQQLTWERGVALLSDLNSITLYYSQLQELYKVTSRGAIAAVTESFINLNQWLQGHFESGWESIESLFASPQVSFVRGGRGEATSAPEAIASVIRLLGSDRPEETRCQAAGVLGEIGTGSPEAIAALTELLDSAREEETRWQAALSLGKIDPGNPRSGVRKARLVDLGLELAGVAIASIVAIVPKPDGRIAVSAQVQLTKNLTKLPPGLKLQILSESGEVRLESQARSDSAGRGIDNAIQRRFSPPPGSRFQIRIALGEVNVTETFFV
ncbi:DUF1822 family protein [Oxynema sp. CENA135]|uniref:DUF1822 family protein n=1 Tax=Oxynema sp. CENA135 TaxID=984206 RepID=UPI00190B43F8|nr:DUF1822 family protein [Oxynema sp. CENA135]MBK4732301.1 DUF1822 family protein [Oxynema sp. CENA135]